MPKTLKWHYLNREPGQRFLTWVALLPGVAVVRTKEESGSTAMVSVPFTPGFQEHDWVKWLKEHTNESA